MKAVTSGGEILQCGGGVVTEVECGVRIQRAYDLLNAACALDKGPTAGPARFFVKMGGPMGDPQHTNN